MVFPRKMSRVWPGIIDDDGCLTRFGSVASPACLPADYMDRNFPSYEFFIFSTKNLTVAFVSLSVGLPSLWLFQLLG